MKTVWVVLTGWIVVGLLLVPATSGTGTEHPFSLPVPLRIADGWEDETEALAPPASTAQWWCAVWAGLDEKGRISRWRRGGVQCHNETGRTVSSGRMLYRKEDAHTDRYRFSRFR